MASSSRTASALPARRRGVNRETPATSLVFWTVNGLADAYTGVEPFGVTLCHLQPKEAGVAMTEDEYLVLAKLPGRPYRQLALQLHLAA